MVSSPETQAHQNNASSAHFVDSQTKRRHNKFPIFARFHICFGRKLLFKYQTGRTYSYLSSEVHGRVVKAWIELRKVVDSILPAANQVLDIVDYCRLLILDAIIGIIGWIIRIIGVQISDGLFAIVVASFIFALLGLLWFDHWDDSFCNWLFGLFGSLQIFGDYCFYIGLLVLL